MSLTSCAASGPAKISIIDTACMWVQPIYISSNDIFTEGTARSILIHNEAWEKNCADPVLRDLEE